MSSKGVALVTGAGQGIGRAIALRLADDGFDVAVNDISEENAEEVVKEIKSKGRQSSIHIANVSVEEQVKSMVAGVVKVHGGLDVMIANAGIVVWSSLIETTEDDWDKQFAVNAKGTFLCYKYAALQMIAQGRGGRIVGASSTAGKKGARNLSAYCGTKFAVRGLTQSAALELGPHKITVNAYAPGAIDTPLLEYLDSASAQTSGGSIGDFSKAIIDMTPLGYRGTPTEIASLVSYLASKEAHFVTGQTILCNGGTTFD